MRHVPVRELLRLRDPVGQLIEIWYLAVRDRHRVTDQTRHGRHRGQTRLHEPQHRVRGGGYILGYNSQLAVSADYLILAFDVVPDPGDDHQLVPMLDKLEQSVDLLRMATNNPDLTVGTALFDAGYASTANLEAAGPDRLIALGKRNNITGDDPPTAPPDEHASPRQRMAWRLSTPGVLRKALYKKRGATVEPVNSHLKDQRHSGANARSMVGLHRALRRNRVRCRCTSLGRGRRPSVV